jgi:hypothetical protein
MDPYDFHMLSISKNALLDVALVAAFLVSASDT